MSPEAKTIELLHWIKDLGLTPKRLKRSDRFLNPYTRKICYYSPKRAAQLQQFCWIPTHEGLKEELPNLKIEELGGLTIAQLGRQRTGAGPGESEALLSLFQQFRLELQTLEG